MKLKQINLNRLELKICKVKIFHLFISMKK